MHRPLQEVVVMEIVVARAGALDVHKASVTACVRIPAEGGGRSQQVRTFTPTSPSLAAGVNPKVVSERLGHSSVAFTLDTYAHVMPGMQPDAAELFIRLVFDGDGHHELEEGADEVIPELPNDELDETPEEES
jgi:hypothetical protein